jgi:hypothetical protein
MALSPNYNWSEPDNSSLVKDGAQAMRTLGDAIDASVWSVGQGQAGKNKIINGSMAIAQRGTSLSGGGYTLDRWYSDTATTVARDAGTAGIPFSIKISNSTGNPAIRQAIELPATGNAGQFTVGSTWTLSYYAKRSTGTTSASAFVAFGAGQFASIISVFDNTNIGTVTTAWQRFSATFTIAASVGVGSTCLTVVAYTNSGTFAGDTWITGVQLEQGSKATVFQTASGNSIQGELALCQRYYYRAVGGNNNSAYAMGTGTSTTVANFIVQLPVTFRTLTSSTIDIGNLCISDGVTALTGGTFTSSSILSSQNIGFVIYTHGSAALTQFRPYRIENNSNSAGYIGFSAEL